MKINDEYYSFKGKEYKIHSVPDEMMQQAFIYAKQRRDSHRAIDNTKHWYDERSGEYKEEHYGVVGEMLYPSRMRYLGYKENIKIAPYVQQKLNLLDPYDTLVFDTEVNGQIDVKTIPPPDPEKRKKNLLVKVIEYHSSIDYYVLIKFIDTKKFIIGGYATREKVLENKPRIFLPRYILEKMNNPDDALSYNVPIRDLRPLEELWPKK